MTGIEGLDALTPGRRVVVAMSGGVDSSVVAALLVERGCEVVGVTLQLYDHGRAMARRGACCAGRDVHDARRVADRLGIAHYVLDYEERFRGAVIDDFVAAYARGETPVPCIRCNQRIKFRDLLATARDLGAEALATGHYVRRRDGADGPELWRARDEGRDQSYFLFATRTRELARLVFPLGGLEKPKVRALAGRFGLAVADKPDSQDICFVPRGHYTEALERLRPEAVHGGEIVHLDGRVLGRHGGIHRFTVGQRRGLGIAWPEPLYVIRIEPATRRIVVGPAAALAGTRLSIGECNWIGGPPAAGAAVTVKLRARQPPLAARIAPLGGERAEVRLCAPAGAIAPGQACVVYDGERVLGGGFIERRPETTPLGGPLDSAPAPPYTAGAPLAE